MTRGDRVAMAAALDTLGLPKPIDPEDEDFEAVKRRRLMCKDDDLSDADYYRLAQARRAMRETVKFYKPLGQRLELVEEIEHGLAADDWPSPN